jgi:D-3-phosphoglycerate dehydrogenase
MTPNIKRLVYFEAWVDRSAERIIAERSDLIDLVRLAYAAPEQDNWAEIGRAHGYQVQSRTELRQPWLVDEALIRRCPDLLACSSTGAGYDVIDVEACTKAGIIVVNQSGTNREAVAEHALGLMLALSKKIPQSDRAMRREPGLDRWAYAGNDLTEKTVGIIGIGQIGSRTAELCRGLFRMRVLAYDPYLSAAEIERRGARKVELDELLRESDFVSVHCPRTKESFGMLGREELRRMKPTAYFIQTARGGIHKEDALAEALREKRIAGAGIDVFLEEPPPTDHPLFAFDNVICSPHIAGVTQEALANAAGAAARQWIAIFEGKAPPRLINPEAWPKYCERFQRLFGVRPPALP